LNAFRLILILSHFCMFAAVAALPGQPEADSAETITTVKSLPQLDRAYSAYGRLLRIFADESGMVGYEALGRDREMLRSAVADIGSISQRTFARLGREGQIALLINAYNLFAIDIVVSNWPIRRNWLSGWFYPGNSIRQLAGAFDEVQHQFLGALYTLDDIERGMLLERYGDPRVHLALVCASRGCPQLRGSPFTADSLDAQLDHQVRRFLASPRNFLIDRNSAEVQLSELFEWYAEDWLDAGYTNIDSLPPAHRGGDQLGEEHRAVIEFVAGYLDVEQRTYLEAGGYDLEYTDYDWSLNDRQ
jgi:uncharacterized protein DUF547